MKTRYIAFLGALLFLLDSCVPEAQSIDSIIPESGQLVKVTAYLDNAPQTKTGLVDKEDGGKSVVWKSGNSISVFYNSGTAGGSKFTTSTNGPIAEFLGNIPAVSGDLSGVGGQAYFWGLYPYNETSSCDGTAITTTLPGNQLAYQGDVADDVLVTVGRSENLSIHFKNACSVIGFTLTQENISKVIFSGNAGEKIAGEFKISFDGNNKLVDTPTGNAVESITITPAESETFQTGVTYYFATLPGTFSQGYSLAFTKTDASEATYLQPSAVTLKASTFYTMEDKDGGLTFQGIVQPNNEIWYKTDNEKILNPISGDFGASLLSNEYEGEWGIIRCDGTITKIPSGCFRNDDSSNMIELHLPATVQTIENNAFHDVHHLRELILPDGCICEPGAFSLMPRLERIIGENVSEDGRLLIQDNVVICFAGYGLSSYEIPNGITGIGPGAFSGCKSLTDITFPDTLEELGAAAFIYCNLSSLDLPGSISIIPSECFEGNGTITSISLPFNLKRIEDYAFGSTTISLKSSETLTIPAFVSYIGEGVSFVPSSSAQYTTLNRVEVLARTPPTLIEENVFGCYSDYIDGDWADSGGTLILVPKESVQLYKADPMWRKYTIRAIEDWE